MRRIAITLFSIVGLVSIDFLSKIFFEKVYFGLAVCSNPNVTVEIFSLCNIEKYIPILGDYI